MPEIITQKVNTEVKYKPEDENTIVSQIVSDFDAWDSSRQSQLTLIREIENLLDTTSPLVAKKDDSFDSTEKKTKLKDAAIKRIFLTSVAHTYNSTFKTPSQMFNVELQDELSDSEKIEFAYKQKAAILDVIKKSKAKKQFRKAVINWYKKGESILYVTWSQQWQLVRRKTGFKFDLFGKEIDLQKWEVQKQLKYDGVRIKCIEPEHFVFDVTRADDFENCTKIYKDWLTYSEIAGNEEYKKHLSKDALKELQESSKDNKDKNDSNDADNTIINQSKAYEKGKIEVLEYVGDITISRDGKSEFLPNMKIVVIARKFIGFFGYNPHVLSPFVYCPFEVDPETGRGIPLLAGLVSNSIATTEVLNKINTALGLSIYKCFLAPKGAFSGDIKVEEGKIIEYDEKWEGNKITPLDFQSGLNIGMQFLQYLKGEGEEETGRFKYSSGDSPKGVRTLGEIKIVQEGQNTLQGYELDILAEFALCTIEKIAESMANFQDQEQTIKYKDKTGKEFIGIIDDTIRQAAYTYTIGDTQASTSKKMNSLEYVDSVMTKVAPYAAQTQQGFISVPELLNDIGSAYDQENPGRLLMPIQPPPEMIPPEQGGIDANTQGSAGIDQGLPPMPDTSLQGNENPLLQ